MHTYVAEASDVREREQVRETVEAAADLEAVAQLIRGGDVPEVHAGRE